MSKAVTHDRYRILSWYDKDMTTYCVAIFDMYQAKLSSDDRNNCCKHFSFGYRSTDIAIDFAITLIDNDFLQ